MEQNERQSLVVVKLTVFILSCSRVPDLYAFIMRHFSARYGNEDEINEVEMGFEELSSTASEIDFTLRDKVNCSIREILN